MLTRLAQPTSRSAPRTRTRCSARARSGAAAGRLAAFVAMLALLPAPAGAVAQGTSGASAGRGAWPWPLVGEVITPYRNGSDRYAAGQHRGLDIAAPLGSAVLAIVDGRVSFSSRLPDGGQTVTLASSDGHWLISHLHLAGRSVTRGQQVRAGQLLGRVGATGRRSADAAHLHLGVRRASDRSYVDPLELLGSARTPPARAAGTNTASARPQLHALEQPARAASGVRAPQTGDSPSTTRHGAERARNAQARSVDAPAREGHAADGISRVAPPPASAFAASASPAASQSPRAAFDRQADEPEVAAAEPAPAPARASSGGGNKRRLALLAISAICLISLFLRSRSTTPKKTAPPAAATGEEHEEAEVIQLDRRAG